MKKTALIFTCLFISAVAMAHLLSVSAFAQEEVLEQTPTADPVEKQEKEPEKKQEEAQAGEQGGKPAFEPEIEPERENLLEQTIFDDKLLLEGYTEKYSQEPLEILLAMIKDDTLNPIRMAAAIRVFKNTYATQIVSREKRLAEKILLRRLNRTDSKYVQIEIRHTLCRMNRYKYFKSMIPALILNLQHYNSTVNEIAFESLDDIISAKNLRAREARIIFNTLRKMLFLSRKRLSQVSEPDEKLTRKLNILRYAIKVLGTQELRRLPKEVINLL